MEDRRRRSSSSHGREKTEERSHHHHSKHKKTSRDDDDHRKKSKKHSRSREREHRSKSDKDVKVKVEEEEDEGWTVVDEDTSCAKDPAVEDSRKRRRSEDSGATSVAMDKDEELRQKRIKIRENGQVQLLDKKFVDHLAEMHPTSGLHELCTRLNWPPPNMSLAFECGPPMGRMYIFKAVVNCQTYQPAVAVDNKKDAKANAAWFALQELGFIKKDPANPL